MSRLVLLGDSVIDNAPYLAPSEADVPAQIRAALPGWSVEMRAVDGHCAHDVAAGLARAPLPDDAAVFLSAGGNDALQNIDLLDPVAPTTFVGAMHTLRAARDAFRIEYARLLDAIGLRPALVATVYDPAFRDEQAALQIPAETALCAWNDTIQSEALARGFEVLELRRLFTDAAHYANAIEPSAAGGARLAGAVAAWCRG